MEIWRENRRIQVGSLSIVFETLDEDVRGPMSDCPKPVWDTSWKEKNRRVRVENRNRINMFYRVVTKVEGNKLYKVLRDICFEDDLWDWIEKESGIDD